MEITLCDIWIMTEDISIREPGEITRLQSVSIMAAQRLICLIRQEESYSSQCSPQSEEVSRIYAEKRNRKKRGIYIVDTVIYNADAVGAYNILRKHHAVSGKEIDMPVTGLSSTKTIKVAV